ncbi:prepilin-type N-terminal cleavage/methylation domain-containing protein [Thalassoglobus sp. JC818]|uniref:prepilin-type N-terminal cleavage/methylation domain-containing protein n=1 Tax=Thalassoglobus sp. JC818 TaxID=3232136 RepID=UPI0034582E77
MKLLRQSVHNESPRAGFSLIEVLIALALTVLLLSAVYSAVGLHLRFQVAGRDQIHRAQLIRALVRKFDSDISALAFTIEEEETASTDTDASTSEESTTDTTLDSLSSESIPLPFGLVGTSEYVHLCVSKPIRELTYESLATGVTETGRTTDLATVTWGTGPIDPAFLIDPTQPAHRNEANDALERRPLTGLGRRVLDFYAFDSATDTLTEYDILAPEITEVQFSYFDGIAWVDSWDSRTLGSLPRAILVTYGLWQTPTTSSSSGRSSQAEGSVFPVEHLFHIPMSIPILE